MGLREIARRPAALVADAVARRVVDAMAHGPDRWSPPNKIAQLALMHAWRQHPPQLSEVGFRVFSQFEEDGLLLCIFALIGMGKRRFVDIGSSDGINSNCANLAINHGWHGLFLDADDDAVERGRKFYAEHPDTWAWPPRFVSSKLNRENVNELIGGAGFTGEVDLLSIDIDGNDYWVWHALEVIRPRVVIVETHVEFGTHNIVFPYDPTYEYPGEHPDYHGASPVAMARMASQLGYRLVGSNTLGFNTIYIRGDEREDVLPEVRPETVLAHPRNAERLKLFDNIRHLPYVEGGSGFPGRPVRVQPLGPHDQGP